MASLKVLTFNTLGIPIITKNYTQRFEVLVNEIAKISPDVVCLQEVWLPRTKKWLVQAMRDIGFRHVCNPKGYRRLSGLVTFSKYEVIHFKYLSLKPIYRFLGFITSFFEYPGDKGYLLTRIKVGEEKVDVFNIHLTADLSGLYRKESTYGHISFRAIGGLSALVQELGKGKMIICGDFNFEPSSWLNKDFSKVTGAVDRVPSDFKTITNKEVFVFPVSIFGKRVDYIFTKNIEDSAVRDVKVLWDKALPEVGYLSDHAGLIADIEI